MSENAIAIPTYDSVLRVIYLHQADHVTIVTVIHGSRDLTSIENKPWTGDK